MLHWNKNRLIRDLLLVLAYIGLGFISIKSTKLLGHPYCFFLPIGLAVGMVYCFGKRTIFNVFLGGLGLSLLMQWNQLSSHSSSLFLATVFIASAAAIQAWLGGAILRQLVDGPMEVASGRLLLQLLLLLPLIGALTATVGVASLVFAGTISQSEIPGIWINWWALDTLGLVIFLPVTMSFIGRPAGLWRPRRWSVSLPIIIFLIATWAVSLSVEKFEQKDLQNVFRLRISEEGSRFQLALNYQELLLENTAQFFVYSDVMTRDKFKSFVRWSTSKSPHIQVIEWMPRIAGNQREQYEKAQQAFYGQDFHIKDIRPGNHLVEAGDRPEYYPITVVEPEEGNDRALGFDPTSSRISKAAIDSAISQGKTTARSPLLMVRYDFKTAVLMLYRPLFKTTDGRYSLDKSSGSLSGFVNAAIRTNDFLKYALGNHIDPDFSIDWIDKSTGESYLGSSFSGMAAPFQAQVLVTIAGRQMELVFAPTPLYVTKNTSHQANVVMFAGLIISGLFGMFLLNISSRTHQISVEVEERTHQLAEATERAQSSEKATYQLLREAQTAQQSLRRAAVAFSAASEGIMIADAKKCITAVNEACHQILGYQEEELLGRDISQFLADPNKHNFNTIFWQHLDVEHIWRGEIQATHKNGIPLILFMSFAVVEDESAGILNYVVVFSDITSLKAAQQETERQANFDALTDLPNRRLFNDRLYQEIRKGERNGQRFALLFIDLDRFKDVNDTLGHHIGDKLLIEASQRVKACVRESDTVARLGGDEFTVILSDIKAGHSVGHIAQMICNSLSQPFHFHGEHVQISTSIGITVYPEDTSDMTELMKNADQAMYEAKKQGRNQFRFYTHGMQEQAKLRMRMATDMRKAMAENQFVTYFQPIVEISSGNVIKAEALLRWQHPEQGFISPSIFIPIAEETGLINEIGDWVFRQAVNEVLRCRQNIHPDFQISVNMSPIQFQNQRDIHLEWGSLLNSLNLSGNSIVIEVTEGLLLNASQAVTDKLLYFRDVGIQVAIDDFGVGYSALSYLKRLDIDFLKIDQSFIKSMSANNEDMAICEAIIGMGHKMGLKVIAEGVETKEQLELLKAIDCDYAQGYLFSQPLPAEMFEKRLARSI